MDNSTTSSGWATARRLWRLTYAADYIGFAVLLLLYIGLQSFAEPFYRLFYVNDHRIQFPHADVERVPVCKSTLPTEPPSSAIDPSQHGYSFTPAASPSCYSASG